MQSYPSGTMQSYPRRVWPKHLPPGQGAHLPASLHPPKGQACRASKARLAVAGTGTLLSFTNNKALNTALRDAPPSVGHSLSVGLGLWSCGSRASQGDARPRQVGYCSLWKKEEGQARGHHRSWVTSGLLVKGAAVRSVHQTGSVCITLPGQPLAVRNKIRSKNRMEEETKQDASSLHCVYV